MFHLSIVLDQEDKWAFVTEYEPPKYELERYEKLLRIITCLPDNPSGPDLWIDRLKAHELHARAEDAINKPIADFFVDDDDLLPTQSKQATKGKLGQVVHCTRKGDGVTLNLATCLFTGTPRYLWATQRGGGDEILKFCRKVKIGNGHAMVFDKGYTSTSTSVANHAN